MAAAALPAAIAEKAAVRNWASTAALLAVASRSWAGVRTTLKAAKRAETVAKRGYGCVVRRLWLHPLMGVGYGGGHVGV